MLWEKPVVEVYELKEFLILGDNGEVACDRYTCC